MVATASLTALLLPGACTRDTPASEAKTEPAPTGKSEAKPEEAAPQELDPPGSPPAICRAAMSCSAQCYAQARAPRESLPACADPNSPECRAAMAEVAPPPITATLGAVQCAVKCEPSHRTLEDLETTTPESWAQLSTEERASWTGIHAGQRCKPGLECDTVCDGEYPPLPTIVRRAERAKAE